MGSSLIPSLPLVMETSVASSVHWSCGGSFPAINSCICEVTPAWRGVAWRGVAWRGVAWRGVACVWVGGGRGQHRPIELKYSKLSSREREGVQRVKKRKAMRETRDEAREMTWTGGGGGGPLHRLSIVGQMDRKAAAVTSASAVNALKRGCGGAAIHE